LTYIGQQPSSTFDSGIQDRFTGLTTNTVTLTHDISAETDILVVWNNIVQDSGTYSVGGTGNKTLTLGGTLVSADIVTVYYTNKVMQSVNPTAGSVGITELNVSDGSNGQALTTNGSGTLSFSTIAGFDVSSITGATALATQPAATDEIVLSDGGTLKRLDIKHLSNTPAFHAVKSGAQSVNNTTSTLVTFETEQLDSDGTFASSRFTPGIAGRYFIYGAVVVDQLADGKANYAQIKKNGSLLLTSQINTGGTSSVTSYVAGHVQLGDSDYVELFSQHNHGSAQNVSSGTNPGSFFGGFRLTGMES